MMPKKRIWTYNDIRFVKEMLHRNDEFIGKLLGCSASCVKKMRLREGILRQKTKPPWTDEATRILKEKYHNTNTEELARSMGYSRYTLYNRANKLGLKKDREFLLSCCFQPGSKAGIAYRFPKGHTPTNKGKKMDPELKERIRHTFFSQGHKPKNTLFDGAVTIRHLHSERGSLPYKYIRISEGKWQELHRHIWEKANGPVPSGYNIVFKNSDTLDCRLENLECISNQELMKRNTFHQWPEELAQVIKLNNKIKKQLQNGKK